MVAKPKTPLTDEDCAKFKENPNINPQTGRKVDPSKGVGKKIALECEKLAETADPHSMPKVDVVTLIENVFDDPTNIPTDTSSVPKSEKMSVEKKKTLTEKFGKKTTSKVVKVFENFKKWVNIVIANNKEAKKAIDVKALKMCDNNIKNQINQENVVIRIPYSAALGTGDVWVTTTNPIHITYTFPQKNTTALAYNLGVEISSDNTVTKKNITDMYSIKHAGWFKKCAEYLVGLNMRQKASVRGYTHIGDALVNSYMRGSFDVRGFRQTFGKDKIDLYNMTPEFGQLKYSFPLHYSAYEVLCFDNTLDLEKCVSVNCTKDHDYIIQKLNKIREKPVKNSKSDDLFMIGWCLSMYFWTRVLKDFTKTLESVIANTPALENDMYVYRGTTKNLFTGEFGKGKKQLFTGKPGDLYENTGFSSSSLNYQVAMRFAGSKGNVQRILIMKGSHVLPILQLSKYPTESEILLNRDCVYLVRQKHNSKGLLDLNNCTRKNVLDIVLI